jgi:molybdenum-dependent DNA-binding transcriptional regulator ModE
MAAERGRSQAGLASLRLQLDRTPAELDKIRQEHDRLAALERAERAERDRVVELERRRDFHASARDRHQARYSVLRW